MDSCCEYYVKCLLCDNYKFVPGRYYELIQRDDKWYICSGGKEYEVSCEVGDENYVYDAESCFVIVI